MELPKTIPLPDRYCTIDQVLDGKFPENSKTNVIGIVEDFLAPIATKGAGGLQYFPTSITLVILRTANLERLEMRDLTL